MKRYSILLFALFCASCSKENYVVDTCLIENKEAGFGQYEYKYTFLGNAFYVSDPNGDNVQKIRNEGIMYSNNDLPVGVEIYLPFSQSDSSGAH